MMNERTQEHLTEAEDIMDELEPYYERLPIDDPPAGFVPQNHCAQFQAVFQELEKAVMNLYTQDEEVQDKIGSHMVTLQNMQEGCMQLPPTYEQFYGFYHNQLKPFAQQIMEFCERNHTELPSIKKAQQKSAAETN